MRTISFLDGISRKVPIMTTCARGWDRVTVWRDLKDIRESLAENPRSVARAPTLEETSRVVWTFDHIENLEKVTFDVKEQTKESSLVTPQVLIPVAGVAITVVAAAAFMLTRKK